MPISCLLGDRHVDSDQYENLGFAYDVVYTLHAASYDVPALKTSLKRSISERGEVFPAAVLLCLE